ncbi:MAG: hypothetical protein EBY39_12985, partial [Flavobacteriia bacterium]|nr:hypothetical protein [Flavobacteriia bacterium]
LKVRAKDAVGNWSVFGVHVVEVDITAPIVPQPNTQTPTNNAQPRWSWNSIIDAVVYEVTLNESFQTEQTETYYIPNTLPQGTHTLKVRAKDLVGNWSDYGVHVVEIDTSAPSIPQPTTDTPTMNDTPTWIWSENLDAVLYEVVIDNVVKSKQTETSYTSDSLADGSHTIKVRAKDSVGNWSDFGVHTILIDTISPNIPQPSTDSPTNNNTPIWNWSEVNDAVLYEVVLDNVLQNTQTESSFLSSELNDGIHTIKVRAKDSVGNWSAYGSHSVLIDTTAPNVPSPHTLSPTNDTTPMWSWAEVVDAVEYEIYVNNVFQKIQQTNVFVSPALPNGLNAIKVRAKDAVGNWSEYGTHIVEIDTTAPNIPQPNTSSPTSNTTPTWNWTDISDSVLYEVSIDEVIQSTQTHNSFTSNELDDGVHEIKVRAKDSVGNWSDYGTHIVQIDTTAPNIPQPNTNTPTENTTPTWTWSRVSEAVQYEIFLDNILVATHSTTDVTINPESYTPTSNLIIGTHEIKVRARDAVGNWSAFGTHIVKIADLTPPNVPAPSTQTPTNNNTPTWNWTPIGDATQYQIILDDVNQGTQSETTYTSTILFDGEHTIKVRASDVHGNWSEYGT